MTDELFFDPTGLSFENASKLLNVLGYKIRVYKKGTMYYILTRDYNTKRVNVNLNDEGYIIDFNIG